jgi:hypothetical protein
MRAADWRVAGDVTDLPVLGVFAVKAGTGGGELRSIQISLSVANTNQHTFIHHTKVQMAFKPREKYPYTKLQIHATQLFASKIHI